ncbi:MAG TPA: hypothetical protein VM537_29885 [Anaerolineae bacterium]|nr:hypothetical protein [Anaerolineae bacterium]
MAANSRSTQLPLESSILVLVAIIEPVVGRYLANLAAQRLYAQLARVDQEALDHLLTRYAEEAE